MTNEPGLKPVDPVLCASIETKQKIQEAIKKVLIPWKTFWKHGWPFAVSEANPKYAEKVAEDEGPPKFMMDILEKINAQEEIKESPTPAATATSN
jgi:hypothetical protein